MKFRILFGAAVMAARLGRWLPDWWVPQVSLAHTRPTGGRWRTRAPVVIPRHPCTFTSIPSGIYASITVKGACAVAPNAVITVIGNINVAPGAVLDAQSAPSTITVATQRHGRSGLASRLGLPA